MPDAPAFAPTSIADRAFWRRVAAAPAAAVWIKAIDHAAATAPPLPPPVTAADFLAARRHNDRARLDTVWTWHRATLGLLVADRCLRGPDVADDRLLNWLWQFATLPTWCVSAHLPNKDVPDLAGETLDLASCEMAALLAEAVEVLRPWLDTQSTTVADAILNEVDRKVVRRFDADPTRWHWAGGEEMSNWSGVCCGSILAACRSLAAQGRPRPDAERAAVDVIARFLDRGFTPDGECDEGVGYWVYGLTMTVLGLSRLTPAELRQRVDVDRLKRVADYARRTHLDGDLFYSGNDSALRVASAPVLLTAPLAAMTADAWLAAWTAASPPVPFTIDWPRPGTLWRDPPGGGARHLGLLLRGLSAADAPPAVAAGGLPPPAPAELLADQRVAIFRVATPAGRTAVTLDGGHNGERHNHNDLGHFNIVVDGRAVVPDLGVPTYTADFFGPKRYEYLSAGSRGHCCPVINGHAQRPGRAAAGRVLAYDPAARRFALGLTAAYPPEAGLRSWTRTMTVADDGTVTIDDAFELSVDGDVVQTIWTADEPTPNDGGWRFGAMTLVFSPLPAAVRVSSIDPVEHRLRDHVDPLWRVEATYAGREIRTTMQCGRLGPHPV